MTCTEEEAKKKWCPQYKVSFAARDSGSDCRDNRGGCFPRAYYCLGSSCMMWEWIPGSCPECEGRGYKITERLSSISCTACGGNAKFNIDKDRINGRGATKGFCGLSRRTE